MADKKTGPVKPPVLDMTARESEKKQTPPAAGEKTPGSATPSHAAKSAPKAQTAPPAKTGAAAKSGPAGAGSKSADTSADTAPKPDRTPPETPQKDATPAAGTAEPRAKPAEPAKEPDKGPAKTGPAHAGAATSATAASTKDGAARAEPARRSVGGGAAAAGIGGAVAGALGGLALAYGLAAAGLWPAGPAFDDADLDSRITQLEAQSRDLAGAQGEAGERIQTVQTQLAARLEAVEDELAGAQDPVSPDAVAALSSDLDELAARIEAIGAGASGEEAEQFGAMLSSLRADLDTLGEQVEAGPDFAPVTDRIDALEPRIETLEAALADQPDIETALAERDRFAQLPGLSAALETALETGAPFAQTLAGLEPLLPDLDIGQDVRTVAASGAPPARAVVSTFQSELPQIIAARPQGESAGWVEEVLDQARAAIAFRPAGELAGDDPDSRLARLENALDGGDFERAAQELSALPPPMAQAAPRTTQMIADRLAAQSLLDEVRALAGGSGSTAAEGDQQ